MVSEVFFTSGKKKIESMLQFPVRLYKYDLMLFVLKGRMNTDPHWNNWTEVNSIGIENENRKWIGKEFRSIGMICKCFSKD